MLLSLLVTAVFLVYLIASFFVFSYSLAQLSLIYYYKKASYSHPPKLISSPEALPFVTIQLPIYNEYYVIDGWYGGYDGQDMCDNCWDGY